MRKRKFWNWLMNFLGSREPNMAGNPPEPRPLYIKDGKKLKHYHDDMDVHIITGANDGYEIWFGYPDKWTGHFRQEETNLFFKWLIVEYYMKARWFGLRRPLYYFVLSRYLDTYPHLKRHKEK